ncbi:MAM and LDL-receptor class A domain-containing protein 1-like [Branchiostoma lanceolatum]|uniref:MAM and LDL-receptor class A domain-containing protein 1-like n=1 Tax=Branchiostoma lanceolatum TaxID=7740 RepID=UPI003456DF09
MPVAATPGGGPTSVPASTPAPGPFNCDFEVDICGWRQADDDNFDWTRNQGTTGSSDTGPSADHTTGSGYYIYIETSNVAANRTARVVSPRVTATAAKCVQFWYHMYGQHVDTLNVYLQTGPSLGNVVWMRTGTQGDQWNYGQIDITAGTSFNMVFEAIRGSGYRGDISLDDISIVDNSCAQVVGPTTAPSISCDFESDAICGYQQLTTDVFDWTWATGNTGTTNTGPDDDHSLGTGFGHYMYIETSSPRAPGDAALLASPEFPATNQQHCLHFYHHMYGQNIGTLNVFIQTGSTLGSAVWSLSGDQGNQWNPAEVTFTAAAAFKVVFEGVRGQSFRGDIAIDDVAWRDGVCSSTGSDPGDCDFEYGPCTWSNIQTGDDFDWTEGQGSTGTSGTGPTADHTTQNDQGTYMFTETSSPRQPGDRARWVSQQFPAGSHCLDFWYHMSGDQTGTLRVIVQEMDGTETTVWQQSGDQSVQWLNGKVGITGANRHRVIIEGVRGSGFRGDISIDDLDFLPSICDIQPPNAVPSVTTPTVPTMTTTPVGTGPTPGPGAFNCDFETDICGWMQAGDDDFDWTRNLGTTGSTQTGPSTDHTTGSGYYIYIETSGQTLNQTARVLSPQLPGTVQRCLTFYYHMYGQHVNTLNVYFMSRGQLGQPVWTKQGTQGDQWWAGQVNLPINPGDAVDQVAFEGVRGTSFRGDIALDDIRLTQLPCSPIVNPSASPLPPTGDTCTFGDPNICGYTQDDSDDFDWTRLSGNTPTTNSGPSNDHTLGTAAGYYMYTEMSSPQAPGDIARLMSPTYAAVGAQCVEFYYHMFGPDIGTLKLELLMSGQTRVPLWTLSDDQGDQWVINQVTINPTDSYQLVFEAIRGASFRGDIAIDDVTIRDGSCGGGGNCDFENGLCTWTNEVGVNEDEFDWTEGSGDTATQNTGPSTDHTTGTGQGTYMFLETSSPRQPGDRAKLVSEVFPATSSNGQCLRFWYHMYGSSIGTLTVWVTVGGNYRSIWQLSGDKGNNWNNGQVNIRSSDSYRVVFEGVRGNSFRGDISIDDITFSTGPCGVMPPDARPQGPTTQNPVGPVTTTTPGPSQAPGAWDCTFEAGLCQYQQATDDEFDWTRQTGSTGTGDTGPASDHTLGVACESRSTPDRYLYVWDLPQLTSSRFYFSAMGNNDIHIALSAQNQDLDDMYEIVIGGWGNTQSVIRRSKQGTNQDTAATPGILSATEYRKFWITHLPDGTIQVGRYGEQNPFMEWIDPNPLPINFVGYSSGWGVAAEWKFCDLADGYYLFIETSDPRQDDDKARVESANHPPTIGQGKCLTFYYHMYGTSVNTLNLYLKSGGALGNPIWTRSGTLGDEWRRAHVSIVKDSNFQITFEGVRGTSFRGDIAIDDIMLADGACTYVGEHVCDFEDPNLCGYTQDGNDDFDWTQQSSSTGTTNTGPTTDHTYGTDAGKYLYIETSSPRQPGDIARLISPSYPATTGQCVKFWYHMYGTSIGMLRVYMRSLNVQGNPLWTKSGDQGDHWLAGQVTVTSTSSFQVVFEGERGTGFTGDIAIDDVQITDGACPNAGDCDFEDGRCTWSNLNVGDDFDWLRGRGDTQSQFTGPTVDHTLGTDQGQYMFIETSNPRVPGETAMLTSETFLAGSACINFWYHMRGTGIVQSQYDCNFQVDLCSWTQYTGDEFDWTRAQGPTGSSQTGPTVDHTVGTDQGWYIYIETSSPQVANDTAVLLSANIPASQDKCLQFWYHMYGAHVDVLNVRMYTNQGFSSPIWTQQGTQGDSWHLADVSVDGLTTQYQIAFEARRGTSYRGDIALDDIRVTDGACSAPALTQPCDFELPDICGFTQDTTDNFDWTQDSGATGSSNTGPTTDHSTGTAAGKYMYIETSAPQQPGDIARLISAPLPGDSTSCLQFYYHMYGSSIGTLNVYARDDGSSTLGGAIWRRTADQGNQWVIGYVTMPRRGQNMQVVFEGIRGTSFRGDIAIDDVQLTPGACPLPGDCDFENGLCGWTNPQVGDEFDWTIGQGQTGSSSTGPSQDTTIGSAAGHYVFLESSSPRVPGDRCWLQSELFQPTSSDGRCLQFSYHMYGSSVGTLRVILVDYDNGNSTRTIWELSSDQGDQWLFAQTPVIHTSGMYYIRLEGERGVSYRGDIAVDDILFLSGSCAVQPVAATPSTPVFPTSAPTPAATSTLSPASILNECTFETGLCGYQQAQDDDIDWIRGQGPTGSSDTGPTNDHTLGTDQGWYVYIEASSPAQPNDTARLEGPTIPLTGPACLRFWYHMYGTHVNRLNVYFKSGGNLGSPVWTQSGSVSDLWILGTVNVPTASTFQPVFEAVRGFSFRGDIGLDDIRVLDGPCSSGFDVSCDFEDATVCGYTQSGTDDFDWTWQSGDTPTSNSGPTNDHTYGTGAGHYFYVEASSPRQPGETAVLYSSLIPATPGRCLEFYYHMYGNSIGTLNVYSNGINGPSVWSMSGDQGNVWHQAQVSVSNTAAFELSFEGVIGTSFRGDIAIDDVTLKGYDCSTAGNCNFENGLCTWTNNGPDDDFDWLIGRGGTNSQFTGPSVDHTLGTDQGHYVFVETSNPRVPGDVALLQSERFQSHVDDKCLRFWYHMFGAGGMGTLTVYTYTTDGLRTNLWRLDTDQGDQWLRGQVSYSSTSDYKVVFEAIRGANHQSDMAIDDVSFSPGSCAVQPAVAVPGATPAPTLPAVTTLPPTIVVGQYGCTFESDLCGWTQDASDTFDWTRSQGPTGSTQTGPTSDHTTATDQGWYLFIETSSPQVAGDAARVLSPDIPAGVLCLQFWYHMYGTHVDTLNVYLQEGNNLGTPVWTETGTQGDQWNQGQVAITKSATFKIVFEGTRGNGYRGDIALDDIIVNTGACPGPGSTAQQCTFDDAGLCGYTQDTQDDFDWTQASGTTGSSGTGPDNDHTTGTDAGMYMYIEASSPRNPGDIARLLSPAVTPGGTRAGQCVEFWYHMYGNSVGTLNVYSRINGVDTSVWSKGSDQGNQWNLAQIGLTTSSVYQVVFEGITGTSFRGDIAIDDVQISDGLCGAQGSCTFENNDLCTWSQDLSNDDFDWLLGQGSTGSQFTGPDSDHTLGTALGYFLFIETSSPRVNGDVARIVSTRFDGGQDRCFSFWYHMYGTSVGSLRVYVQEIGSQTVESLLWELSGDQTNQWYSGQVGLASRTNPYQLVFEGVRGDSYRGDIAIDDLTVTNSFCSILPTTANPGGQVQIGCDFDSGFSACSWTQSTADDFDWTLTNITTTTTDTGPSYDHTTGAGHYIYIESSSPRSPGDTAMLESSILPPTNPMGNCLSFWYHMWGVHIAQLNIYTFVPSTGQQTLVWSKDGAQDNRWVLGVRSIKASADFKIQIEGVVGTSYRGDIALDDVVYGTGPCPALSDCDFETDFCGAVQASDDDFDWSRGRNGTATTGTGPTVDHTTGTPSGYYAYIETSAPRQPNDKARLQTPMYLATPASCFQFWYHMYGANIGTLNVYLKTGSSNTLLWTKSGDNDDVWRLGYVTVSSPNDVFQVVFEGVRGQSFRGDIAIDDLQLRDGSCPPPGFCNFEQGLCSWSNAGPITDQFDWLRNQGGTPSSVTGPAVDHTTNTDQGFYMFTEVSDTSLVQGDRAILWSEHFPAATDSCFSLWYHMYGTNVGALYVQKYTQGAFQPVWDIQGQVGNVWQFANISLSSNTEFQITVIGEKGNGYTGDIAVDDLNYQEVSCGAVPTPAPTTTPGPSQAPSSFDCNFETDLCTWTQSATDDFNWSWQQGSTATSNTGPEFDHTLQNSQGHYVFIETSSGNMGDAAQIISAPITPTSSGKCVLFWYNRLTIHILYSHYVFIETSSGNMGDAAQIISAPITPTSSGKCVLFWYHMYGAHVNTLNLKLRGTGGDLLLWTLQGTHGNEWRYAQVRVTEPSTYSLVFEGLRGSSYEGDIALDDIAVRDGECPPPDACDFEQSDLCGYTQDITDDFDWTQQSGASSTANSGPSNDHTYSTSVGKYVYIETSSPRQPGDSAKLTSPAYPASQGKCLQFWYHMFGTDIGELTVYTKTSFGLSPQWTLRDNQGDFWHVGRANLAHAFPYQIVFEGVRGQSYRGDIAIDDVLLSDGFCGPAGACDFEANTCAWYNTRAQDNFDWVRQRGVTASSNTGPSADHTSGNGYYMYLEASAPRQQGDKAWLLSEAFQTGPPARCLRFWYHMFGNGIGTLKVWMQKSSTQLDEMWSLSGDQGDQWQQAFITLRSDQTYTLIVEGTVGTSHTGDISLDDIEVTNGECTVCDTKSTDDQFRYRWDLPPVTGSRFEFEVQASSDVHVALSAQNQNLNNMYEVVIGGWGNTQSVIRTPTAGHQVTAQTQGINSPTQYQGFWISWASDGTIAVGRANEVSSFMQWVDPNPLPISYAGYSTGYGSTGQWRFCSAGVSPTGSPGAGFDCGNGQSVPLGNVCDFKQDCSNGNDELNCGACTFEQNACTWTDVSTGSYSWRRDQDGTTTANTGPSVDHTLGTTQGWYMAVEAYTGTANNLARLKSPTLRQGGPACMLKFWYHMYGSGIGSLSVFVQRGPVTQTQVWTLNQDRGDQWRQAVVYVGRARGDFTVLFEAQRSFSTTGDIAIDDITFENCALPAAQTSCTRDQFRCSSLACVDSDRVCDYSDDCGDNSDELQCSNYPARCDFETSLCSWQQMADDDFDWTRANGNTASVGTGPSRDHTLNTDAGYYVYIEASSPRTQGDRARLAGPTFQAVTGDSCKMRLFFHMLGQHIGALRVMTRTAIGGPMTTVWSRNTAIGDYFDRNSVTLQSATPFQVVIEGEVGSGHQGDIALDDISFSSGCQLYNGLLPSGTTAPPTTGPCPSGQFSCVSNPTCIPNAQVCDFTDQCTDGSDEDICGATDFEADTGGWTDTSSGQYSWRREPASVSTDASSPNTDHTLGTATGHFMYLEGASGLFVNAATMQTPALGATGLACQLNFWYHMNGAQSGTLAVNLVNTADATDTRQLWAVSGSQGDQWNSASVSIGEHPAGYKVVMQGSPAGLSFLLGGSDLAIDDVTFMNCCPTCLPPQAQDLNCDFEADQCGYYQSQDDEFDWIRSNNGPDALEQGTGPGFDHTSGTGAVILAI